MTRMGDEPRHHSAKAMMIDQKKTLELRTRGVVNLAGDIDFKLIFIMQQVFSPGNRSIVPSVGTV